jgi:hypothetical protein
MRLRFFHSFGAYLFGFLRKFGFLIPLRCQFFPAITAITELWTGNERSIYSPY